MKLQLTPSPCLTEADLATSLAPVVMPTLAFDDANNSGYFFLLLLW